MLYKPRQRTTGLLPDLRERWMRALICPSPRLDMTSRYTDEILIRSGVETPYGYRILCHPTPFNLNRLAAKLRAELFFRYD